MSIFLCRSLASLPPQWGFTLVLVVKMNRYVQRILSPCLAAMLVMFVLESPGWSQQLETRDDHEGWLTTELSDSQSIRWRIIRDRTSFTGSGSSDLTCDGTIGVEVPSTGGAVKSSTRALDLGGCGCDPVIRGVYRHQGKAVAVLQASNRGTSGGGDEFSSDCIFAVCLTSTPEILFERHLASHSSNWAVPSRPHQYRFVPMRDLLLVVMEGDGALPWPVGGQPATQSSTMATIAPLAANEVALMSESMRSRLAPVSMVGQSSWALLQEPFTYPPRRVVVGATHLNNQTFSAELSYDGPKFQITIIHGDDGDEYDPLPSADLPLADYRWGKLKAGPQMLDGEVELIAYDSKKEIHKLRWPCHTDPYEWDQMRGYELPRHEEWVVLLDMSDSETVEARVHLVRSCLTFQITPFFHGRGGLFRSFENGTLEKIIENGRTVGVEIQHSRPRILTHSGRNPLPDEREFFENSWPNDDWWRPFFDGPNTGTKVVLRID